MISNWNWKEGTPDFDTRRSPNTFMKLEEALMSGEQVRFLLIGNTGSGKTYTLKALKKHFPITIHKPHDLYSEYLRLLDSQAPDKHRALQALYNTLCSNSVCLDDLGTEPPTESAHAFMSHLLINAYEHWTESASKAGIFIITTNLRKGKRPGEDGYNPTVPSLLNYYGDRVVSRLTEIMTVCFMGNHSFREEKKVVIEG